MEIQCPKCNWRYDISDEYGGQLGFCNKCEAEFVIPIPDHTKLLAWAKEAPWQRLQRFVQTSSARGHSRATIDQLIRITEERRWVEEAKILHETAPDISMHAFTQREKAWARSETILGHRNTLEELRKYAHEEFQRFIVGLFTYQGFVAHPAGPASHSGVDVLIKNKNENLWAVAKCKRYAPQNRITAAQIRDFAGAFLLSGAERGFVFTTGALTSDATKTAAAFDWLTVYSGMKLVKYIESVESKDRPTGD